MNFEGPNWEEPKDAATNEAAEDPGERWLEDALAHYSAAEPRTGLEIRILANLQAQAAQRQRRWIFGFAAAAVLLLAVLVTSLLSSSRKTPNEVVKLSPPVMKPKVVAPVIDSQPQEARIPRIPERRAVPHPSMASNVLEATNTQQEKAPVEEASAQPEETAQSASIDTGLASSQEAETVVAEEQPPADKLPGLSIQPIEIKELKPIQGMDSKGKI